MTMSMNRRNVLIGASCVAAVAAAEALRPRRHISYLSGKKLDDVIPRTMPGWTSSDVSDLVRPREEDSLASRIYEQTVGRVYAEAETGFQVMMLAAYGETQSRDLQLHRPEACYPASGFTISDRGPTLTPLASGVVLPTRRLIADAPGRREMIVYWARLGDFFPVGGLQQRVDVLRAAIGGQIVDGVLIRVSALAPDPERAFSKLDDFISRIVSETRPENRLALIGGTLGQSLAQSLGPAARSVAPV
jgi:EpsI family protein